MEKTRISVTAAARHFADGIKRAHSDQFAIAAITVAELWHEVEQATGGLSRPGSDT